MKAQEDEAILTVVQWPSIVSADFTKLYVSKSDLSGNCVPPTLLYDTWKESYNIPIGSTSRYSVLQGVGIRKVYF